MNGFEGLKEYSFFDLAKSKVAKLLEISKDGLTKVRAFWAEHEEAVEVVVKSFIVISGICIAIKDAISDKKLKSTTHSDSKSGSRLFCFFVDIFNVIKRIL